MYKELDKSLRKIRWRRKISNYKRWNESKSAVDDYYSKRNISADTLYTRIVTLKRKIETFNIIAIPTYITLVFGILITLGINAITKLVDDKTIFKSQSKDIFDNAVKKLTDESIAKVTVLYNEILKDTLLQYTFIIAIMIVCLVVIAILLCYVLYPIYQINNSKFVVFQYEIKVAELKLKELEAKEEKKPMKEIKYEDYLFLGANAVSEELQVSFLEYFKFLLETDFEDLEKQLKERLEIKKFQKRSNEQLIEGIIATTPKELEKKREDKNYYMCNAICLLKTIREIFTKDLYSILSNENTPEIALHNYEHILKWFLLDSDELCNLYANNMKSDFQYKANIDSRYIHYMSIHQILRQSLYGQISAHSFSDMEISASIAVIRQLIEIRIRRAFGVVSYIDEQGNLIPLDLSRIIEAVKRHKKEIEFPITIENIERIYKWANMYIHSGRQELSWIPYFIEKSLKNLSFGKIEENQWDAKNGISTTQNVIDKIHNELLEETNNSNLKIYSSRLELILK